MPLKWGQGPGQEAEEESQKCGLYLQDRTLQHLSTLPPHSRSRLELQMVPLSSEFASKCSRAMGLLQTSLRAC